MAETAAPGWVSDVLEFWFEELEPRQWFVQDLAVDALINARFQTLPDEVAAVESDVLLRDAKTALAAILVLDQFPRNLFRNTMRSFAYDGVALQLAERAVELGYDKALSVDERLFLYLPFEHSEAVEDQERSVELISALDNSEYTQFAIAHRDIIARFGRFPHRNRILNRPSTEEEEKFLLLPGSSF